MRTTTLTSMHNNHIINYEWTNYGKIKGESYGEIRL
jgi:hypothetical protein